MSQDLIGFQRRLWEEYGDTAYFRLGPHHCYQFVHPEHVQEVLVTKAKCFGKSKRLCQVFGRFEGRGLVVSDGPLWERQRKLIQPAFRSSQLQPYMQIVDDATGDMLQNWHCLEDVDFLREMIHLAMQVLTRSLFSTSWDEAQMDSLQAAVAEIQRWAIREFNKVFATPRWVPLIGQPHVRRALKFLDKQVWGMIHSRQKSRAENDDLLGRLLAAHDDNGRAMPLRQVRDEVITLLLAGHETMGVALAWTGWLLAANPDIQETLAHDLKETADNAAEESRAAQINMRLASVFQESLRLYPPVYSFTREVRHSVQIGAYDLTPGSQVFLSPYLTQRDPRWFAESERFDPSRFNPGWENRIPRCAWYPFGAGPRGCIGQSFAIMEAGQVLKAVLKHYRLRSVDGSQCPSLDQRLSLHPRGGLSLRIELRK